MKGEKKLVVTFQGAKVYDPRDNTYKVSANPALMMADLFCRGLIITPWNLDKTTDSPFWNWIAKQATDCDVMGMTNPN